MTSHETSLDLTSVLSEQVWSDVIRNTRLQESEELFDSSSILQNVLLSNVASNRYDYSLTRDIVENNYLETKQEIKDYQTEIEKLEVKIYRTKIREQVNALLLDQDGYPDKYFIVPANGVTEKILIEMKVPFEKSNLTIVLPFDEEDGDYNPLPEPLLGHWTDVAVNRHEDDDDLNDVNKYPRYLDELDAPIVPEYISEYIFLFDRRYGWKSEDEIKDESKILFELEENTRINRIKNDEGSIEYIFKFLLVEPLYLE